MNTNLDVENIYSEIEHFELSQMLFLYPSTVVLSASSEDNVLESFM